MKCLNPILIANPKEKSRGLLPGETKFIYVPCGKCIACVNATAKEYTLRILHESEKWKGNMSFITLTYSDENLHLIYNPITNDFQPVLYRRDYKNFFKKLRKATGQYIKYFGCGEYGDPEQFTGRCHFHFIVFGLSPRQTSVFQKCWFQGQVKVGTVEISSIRYVAGYVEKKVFAEPNPNFMFWENPEFKKDKYPIDPREFRVWSKGFGKDYALKHEKQLRQQEMCTVNGKPSVIPRYYLKVLDWEISGYRTDSERQEFLRKQMLDFSTQAQRELNMRAKNSFQKEMKKLKESRKI